MICRHIDHFGEPASADHLVRIWLSIAVLTELVCLDCSERLIGDAIFARLPYAHCLIPDRPEVLK